MRENAKRVSIPEAGDDLLQSFDAAFNSAGIVLRATSIQDARAMVANAERIGTPPTAEKPWYFDVGGIMYRCTGYKGGNQVYDLQCINEVEIVTDQAPSSVTGNRGVPLGQSVWLVTSRLGAKPYDRMITASGTAWCTLTRGHVDLELYLDEKDRSTPYRARVPYQGTGNTAVTAMGFIPAGKKPTVSLWFTAVPGGATQPVPAQLQTSGDTWTRLTVSAFPTSMS